MSGQARPPHPVRISIVLFRRLLALMPSRYRSEQRAEAVELLATLVSEAHRRRGTLGVAGVMLPAVVDLCFQMIRQRMHPPARLIRPNRLTIADRLVLIGEAAERDLRDGFRAVAARPGHSAAVIGTLALGIGLNAAVFSVVDWVLLRPLPYPSPEDLVRVWTSEKAPVGVPADLTYSEVERVSAASSFRAAAGVSMVTRVSRGHGLEPAHAVVARVTGDLFGVLGTYPILGRAFDAAELTSGRPVIVLGQSIWRNRFASDPAIIGRVITLDNQPHTVVGVMPPGRGYPRQADLWRPSTASERADDDRENLMIARLASGVDHGRAMSELATLATAPDTTPGRQRTVWVDGLHASDVRDVSAALTWVLASAALVLLVACTNIAALIAARGADRAGELAVRAALGARGGQLARQLMVECVVLASAGGALGVVLAASALDAIVAIAPGGMPRLDEITIDGRVIGASLLVTLVAGAVVGVAPAWRAGRVDLRSALAASGAPRSTARGVGRSLLVAAQIAVAVVLTIGAGLLTRSLQQLITFDHGFNPDRLVAVSLNVRGTEPAAARRLFHALVDSAERVPEVRSAAVAFRLPTEITGLRVPVRVDGMPADRASSVALRLVTPRYFDTAGIAVTEGRGLAATDTQTSRRVGVVNRAFVRQVLSGAAAIDTRLASDVVEGRVTIVGVVADVTPAGEADRPALYMSFDQFAINAGSLLVRTEGNPTAVLPALTARIRAIAPALPLDRVQTMDEALAAGRSVARFNTLLASSFGLLALVLAAIGVYGLTAGDVAARRRESSVRTALGATQGEVLWSLMRPIGRIMVFGLGVGVVAALGVAMSMGSLLHGIRPLDPLTFLALPAFIAVVGISAILVAARPALRADAAATLRR